MSPEVIDALKFAGTLLAIFGLRVVEVSLGTLRIIYLIRRRRALAAVTGFFASLTWIVAAAAVLSNLDDPARAVSFAAGYAAGTIVGGWLEERLAIGKAVMRIFTDVESPSPAEPLRAAGFGVTVLNAEGLHGRVRLAFSALDRKRIPEAMRIVREINEDAFVTIEDTFLPDVQHRRYDRR